MTRHEAAAGLAEARLRQAEARLREYAAVTADRDARVRAAVAAGVSKRRVHELTGIGRMTIDRILASGGEDHGPSTAREQENDY
jgi:hypothetical protein